MAKTEKTVAPTVEEDKENPLPFAADEADGNEPAFEAKEVVLGGEKKADPEPPPVDSGAAELQRQLDVRNAELREREYQLEAERARAQQAERQTGVISVSMIDQAIEAAKNQSGQLRAQFVAAQTAGNYEAAADIQIAIADNRANLLALQQQRQAVEAYSQQQQQPRSAPPPQAAQTVDGPSQIAAQLDRNGYAKSAEWIRAHRDIVADSRGVDRVNAAHQYAVNIKGLIPETPEYFAKIEEELGLREPERAPVPRPSAPIRTPTASAPVTSSTPSLNGQQRRGVVTLTAAQREHAHNVLGMTDEEYAAAISDPAVQKRLLGAR